MIVLNNKDLNENKEIIKNNSTENAIMPEDFSKGRLSREYFDKIDKLTTDLDMFVKKTLTQSTRLLKYVHEHPYYGAHYDDLEEYAPYIKVFVMKDLCNIYKKVKCSVSIYKNEGKILFMYALKALGTDTSFEIYKELCNPKTEYEEIKELRKITVNLIKNQYDEELPFYPDNDFVIHSILEDENLDMMDKSIRYMVLMYQFASAVAKANGKISEDGSKWLKQLATQI